MKPEETRVDIGSLVPNPRNPRRHPERQIEHLVAAVRRFGQMRRILVRRDNKMVIGGHGLLEACKRLGYRDVDVAIADWDQKTADAYMVADNRLAQLAQDDEGAMAALLADFGPDDFEAIGFSDDEVERLLGDDDEDSVQIRSIETGEVYDKFWITAHGPLELQAEALTRIRQLMADLPGVQVDIGTVAQDLP